MSRFGLTRSQICYGLFRSFFIYYSKIVVRDVSIYTTRKSYLLKGLQFPGDLTGIQLLVASILFDFVLI